MYKNLTLLLQISAEVAAPLAKTKKVTMVSTGNGEVGAAKLTSEVLQVIEKLPQVVEGMTGVNISKVTLMFYYYLTCFSITYCH